MHALIQFMLATEIHSLARYSKRTIELLRALSYYSYKVSGSFNFLLRVLFNVPSRYIFTIGLSEYLGLGVDASRIHIQYPVNATLELVHNFLFLSYGAITLFGRSFQITFNRKTKLLERANHISFYFHKRIQSALRCFRSLLLTASLLISFPAGTKTLHFPAFPILTDL